MRRLLAVAALAATTAGGARGQEVRVLRADLCDSCRLASRTIAVIGSTDGPGALAVESPFVSRDRRGRFYLYGYGVEGVAVYDSSGAFLRRIGRAGSGPGEYRGVSGLTALPGDSLALLDGMLRRLTILAPDFSVSRILSVDGAFGNVALGTGGSRSLFANAPDARRGPAVSEVDPGDGKTLRTLATADDTELARVPEGTMRALAAGPGGALWVAFLSRYRLEQFAPDGSRAMVLTREADWFPLLDMPVRQTRLVQGEPSTVVQSMTVDATGRIWMLMQVADPRWRSAVKIVPDKRFPEITDKVRHTDTLLEVIDPRTQRVVFSHRFDVPQTAILPGLVLIEAGEDDQGRPVLRAEQLALEIVRR